MIWDREIFVYKHAADAIDRYAERMPDERRAVSGRPDFHTAGNEFVADLQTFIGKIGRVNSGPNFDAKVGKLLHGAVAQVFRIRREHFWLTFDQNHARL